MYDQESKLNILLVDDNPVSLLELERVLTPLNENLIKCTNGTDALKFLLENEVAVILLDVQMPEMDGYEVAELIRANEKLTLLPIIFITSHMADDDNIKKAYRMGVTDFILKTTSPIVLLHKVKFFIELFKKTQKLNEYHQQQHQRLMEELELSRSQLQALNVGSHSTVSAEMAGLGTIAVRYPDQFALLKQEYKKLLEAYIVSLGYNENPPRREINSLADRIGLLGGGPRDIIDIHLQSVLELGETVSHVKSKVYIQEGRLMAIEIMGYLVDFYRFGRVKI